MYKECNFTVNRCGLWWFLGFIAGQCDDVRASEATTMRDVAGTDSRDVTNRDFDFCIKFFVLYILKMNIFFEVFYFYDFRDI
jgi:hypothetical protein